MLSEEELVKSIMAKMPDFSISVAELKAPTAKFVQSYYVRLLEELGIDFPDSIEERMSDNLGCLDTMNHILPVFKLYSIMSSFCEQIYLKDFSLTDITEPSPGRTFYLMKALDIYHGFADWEAQRTDMKLEHIYRKKAEMDRLNRIKDELQEKLNIRSKERAQANSQIKERQHLAEVRTALLEESARLDVEVEKAEDVLNSEKQQLECVKEDLHKLNSEFTRLQSQVVSSPARLEKELHAMQLRVANSENEYQQLLQNKKEKCQLKDTYKRNIALLENCQTLLMEMVSARETTTKLSSRLEDRRRTKAMKCQERKDKADKIVSKTKKMQKELESLRLQLDKEEAEFSQAMAAGQSEIASLRMNWEDEQRRSEEVKVKIQEAEETFQMLLEANSKQNREFQEKYDKRVAEQDEFMDKCEEKMKKFLEELKRNK